MADKSAQVPPSLRRWDSTPDTHVDAEVKEILEDERAEVKVEVKNNGNRTTNLASGAFARPSEITKEIKSEPKPIKANNNILKASERVLDPFSASPAPGTPGESSGMKEYLRRRNGNVNRDNLRTAKIRSRPAAIASARIRAPSEPKPTIEIAQGLNSFGHTTQISDDGVGPSTSSFSGGSQRTGSGFSASGSNISIDSRSPNLKNASNTSLTSPASNRRSIFGTGWTLGRRSGSQISNSAIESGSFDEQEEDLSATVTDATRSLRRLTSYGSKR
ncbi:hypothetical protein L7F22_053994 [Adiantum nelumboides]|nr:hypothetical protein [Adiantum nelumboides]